ncbi:MAG: hypothetical protein ACXVFT_06170 [Solirubrobacteraceae bacterium]
MTPQHKRLITPLAATAALLALPVTGAAAARPSASTGPAASVTDQSASLTGSVNPRGSATTYSFQYGPTVAYGSATPAAPAGSGSTAKRFVATIDSLTPYTRYHYRIVAHNAGGTTLGADRTFRTAKQPLGFQIGATPNPIPFGQPTTIAGTLTGTGGGNRKIVLQQRQFPYTSPWAAVGNTQVTAADGAFSFPGVPVAVNSQFRVTTSGGPSVTSPVVTAGVAVRVSTLVSTYRVHRGGLVRFSGHITPARDSAQIGIQKLNSKGHWVTVAGTIAHHSTTTKSRYAKHVRVTRGGSYRIYALIVDGNYVSSVGRTVKLRTR